MSQSKLEGCKFCPFRKNLQELKHTKKFMRDTALKIENNRTFVSLPTKERKEMTFRDIIEDVKNKYPKWKEAPIVVPHYDFCGIKDRLIWTENDIHTHLKKKFYLFYTQS